MLLEYISNKKVSVTVIVPTCPNFDSAVNNSEDITILDNYGSSIYDLEHATVRDSEHLRAIIDSSQESLFNINDVKDPVIRKWLQENLNAYPIDDDPIPGLDVDLTEEQIRDLYTETSDVELAVYAEGIVSDCKDKIEVYVDIQDKDFVDDFINLPVNVKIIKTGSRRTITHTVVATVGEGEFVINNPPPGTYSFEVKSAIVEEKIFDIFSRKTTYYTVKTVTIEDCTDETSSSVIPDSISYDYTLSVSYPMYLYVEDVGNCASTIDKHLFGWWMNINPLDYDVDSGVFVGKIKVEH